MTFLVHQVTRLLYRFKLKYLKLSQSQSYFFLLSVPIKGSSHAIRHCIQIFLKAVELRSLWKTRLQSLLHRLGCRVYYIDQAVESITQTTLQSLLHRLGCRVYYIDQAVESITQTRLQSLLHTRTYYRQITNILLRIHLLVLGLHILVCLSNVHRMDGVDSYIYVYIMFYLAPWSQTRRVFASQG